MAIRAERCPWHEDRTASLKLMTYGWRCYGCDKRPTHAEVETALGKTIEQGETREVEKEDLKEKFKYINSLPKKEIRGLLLPEDERGYYIVWPDEQYYKYRLYSSKPKYVSPRGHQPPLLWARNGKGSTLWVVEGEINSLSVSKVVSDDVCSPGSATIFDRLVKKHLTQFMQYSTINVVVDNDSAGIKALIAAKSTFLHNIPFAKYIRLEKDCNEILCEEGPKELRRRLLGSNYS